MVGVADCHRTVGIAPSGDSAEAGRVHLNAGRLPVGGREQEKRFGERELI